MQSELKQVLVQTAADIPYLNDLAIYLAGRAGFAEVEQIRFACHVVNSCYGKDDELLPATIEFGVTNDADCSTSFIVRNAGSIIFERPIITGEALQDELQREGFKNAWKPRSQLEHGFQEMQQFTLALAHDLKNSLTKLRLALSLAEIEEMPGMIRNYMEIVHRSSAQLEKTMLSLNHVVHLGYTSDHVVKQLLPSELLNDIRDEFSEALANAEVKTDFSQLGSFVYPKVFLTSVFSNLISNSIKYRVMDRPLEISIFGTREGNQVVLHYSDNGQGIDLERFGAKLFKPFERFIRNTDGSGLGLFLIKSMVERNGGRIEVESSIGNGVTFRFYLNEYQLPIPREAAISGIRQND